MGSLNFPDGAVVAVDSAVFIYYIEGIEPYSTVLGPFFADVEQGRLRMLVSAI